MMTKLSVNVNKIATLRNARGGNIPNLDLVVRSIIKFGVNGITIHPRPDERHIKKEDVFTLSTVINNMVEFNIEGFPSDEFIDMVLSVKPTQVTLVPDSPDVLTSLDGWDTIRYKKFLTKVVHIFNSHEIRTSIFVNPEIKMIEGASIIQANRVELFTGEYAQDNRTINKYTDCSNYAHQLKLSVNAGHDLSLKNLKLFRDSLPFLHEISVGHSLISESLFLGLEETINRYKKILS